MATAWNWRLADAIVAWRRPILLLFALITLGFTLGLN